jgi:hypothetical protein
MVSDAQMIDGVIPQVSKAVMAGANHAHMRTIAPYM